MYAKRYNRRRSKFSKYSVWASGYRFRRQVFIMYHSTKNGLTASSIVREGFRASEGSGQMLGNGIYVASTRQKADGYGDVMFKLLVYPGYVATVDKQGHPLQKTWHKEHESAWVPPECGMVRSGLSVSM